MHCRADSNKPTPRHRGKVCVLSIFVILITCVSFYVNLRIDGYDKVQMGMTPFIRNSQIIWKGVWNTFHNDTFNYKTDQNEVLSQSDIFKLKLKENIISGNVEPLLTLFTTWNSNSEKDLVHNNTVRNWLSFRPYVIPVIFTNETSIASECRQNGWDVLPVRQTAADDVPVLKFMYLEAMKAYNTTYYAYSNSDILYSGTLVDTLIGCAYNLSYFLNVTHSGDSFLYGKSVYAQEPTLIVGQRTNVQNVTNNESLTWAAITSVVREKGRLFFEYAIDYFITPSNYPWGDSAEVIIGTLVYDNWLIYNARIKKHLIIDATSTLLALHQTTSAGNYESRKHINANYNRILLRNLYKNFKEVYGFTWCAEYQTKYSQGHVVVTNRSIAKECGIIK